MLRRVVISVMVSMFFFVSAYGVPKASLTEQETSVINSYERGLAELASKSTTAQVILDFYLQNKILARVVGNSGELEVLEDLKANFPFVVAIAVDSNVYLNYGHRNSFASTQNGIIVVSGDNCTDIVRGWVLAHEINHIISEINGQENLPENAPEDIKKLMFCAGEADAHIQDFDILNEYTKGKYQNILRVQYLFVRDRTPIYGWLDPEKV